MDTDKIVAANLENANLVAKGMYNGLQCPKCDNRTAEAFFTKHAQEEKYGIWFECKKCGNVEHISCRERPEGYNSNRISEKYQRLDERSWSAEKEFED